VIESPELGEAQSEYLQKRAFAKDGRADRRSVQETRSNGPRALLEKSQGITLTEVQKREGEYRTAEAELRNAETAEQMPRAIDSPCSAMNCRGNCAARRTGTLDPRFTVTAPISGQVVEREATLGELVGPDRERLLAIADMSKLWVSRQSSRSKAPPRVSRIEGTTCCSALRRDHWCEGKVVYVSPSLDLRTRTVDVRIEAEDRHPELRPGIFAQAEIELAPEARGRTRPNNSSFRTAP
jgi:cobalt-zinc-cadmium efflux system membrane fusion protein